MSFVSAKKGEILQDHEKLFGFTPDATNVSVAGLRARISDERPLELRGRVDTYVRSELTAIDVGKIALQTGDVRATTPLLEVCS